MMETIVLELGITFVWYTLITMGFSVVLIIIIALLGSK